MFRITWPEIVLAYFHFLMTLRLNVLHHFHFSLIKAKIAKLKLSTSSLEVYKNVTCLMAMLYLITSCAQIVNKCTFVTI